MKKQAGITMTIMLYLMAAIAIAYVIRIGGNYPTGVDTMCHVYKGDVLYHAIRQGNWYPLYDRFWYNGVQMMRYWAPLPVYFLVLSGDRRGCGSGGVPGLCIPCLLSWSTGMALYRHPQEPSRIGSVYGGIVVFYAQ